MDQPTDAHRPQAPLVVLTVWGVPTRAVPAATARMALDRPRLRATEGLRFAKLLGTGDGTTFTVRDADPHHWALLTVWDGTDDGRARAAAFALGPTHRRWAALAGEQLQVTMTPTASRGRWSGRTPFEPAAAVPRDTTGPVASITRARLRLRAARTFWRAVPAVSQDLRSVNGLRLALGIGEAPIGLQGTFSLWDDARALNEFAYRRRAHTAVVDRTPVEGWYAEELFARFAVESATGTFTARRPRSHLARPRPAA